MNAEAAFGARGEPLFADRRSAEARHDAAQNKPVTPKLTRQTRRKRLTATDFARWGRQGGATRARRMTVQARHESARRAGLKRWDGISPAARSEHARKAVAARWRKPKGDTG